MSTASRAIYFGPYEVTDQIFYSSPLSHAVVNIKPLLPGHVLVIPHRAVERFTELSVNEISDLFATVQNVQRMLARTYFRPPHSPDGTGLPRDGSFNLAIQDGVDAGMTVPHTHCHIIPRIKGTHDGDEIYTRMNSEEGNVGSGFWDSRPVQKGMFPRIEDKDRKPRSMEEMVKEAEFFRKQMDGILNDSS
ncbi:putative Bis-tetraphosphatase [Xylogone sp. PMI_703]|nr:putative Bis-tetraphosphatase [Xylogone sp. PMI_703]